VSAGYVVLLEYDVPSVVTSSSRLLKLVSEATWKR